MKQMESRAPQNANKICFWAIWVTFIYDLKIDLNTHEPHNDKFLFSETSPIVNSAEIWEKDSTTGFRFEGENLNKYCIRFSFGKSETEAEFFYCMNRERNIYFSWQLRDMCLSEGFPKLPNTSRLQSRYSIWSEEPDGFSLLWYNPPEKKQP